MFSATIPTGMSSITEKFLRNPVIISVKAEQLTLEGIKQYYVAVTDDACKYSAIKEFYKYLSVSQSIIYCNSVPRVCQLFESMREDGFPVCCLHGSMEKEERAFSFNEFKSGAKRVMISSNVSSRGIDVQQVSTVTYF